MGGKTGHHGLYSIHAELQALCTKHALTVQLVPLLGSVRNYSRVSEIFKTYRPSTVYHAAAYKHVPLVEENPAEGIANNVFGTLHVARAALENGVAQCILVSTDKAVRPTNVMGASKRVAELILQALADESRPVFDHTAGHSTPPAPHATCFAMVRFGNVLGSSGSVVPLFRQQIASGGPMTVTHAEVTRYFMTIPEAAQLVLQAGAMAEGGDVFVLDMGAPVKVLDLAKRMVALSGFTVRDLDTLAGDIDIQIVGLRPGEKLYEELLIGNNPATTLHPRIMKAHEEFIPWSDLSSQLQVLCAATNSNDVPVLYEYLAQLVPGCALQSPPLAPETASDEWLEVRDMRPESA